MGFVCSIGNKVVHGNGNRLLWHVRNRHALISGHIFSTPVTCGQGGCLQTFRFSAAFKRHIENKHNNTNANCNENNDNDHDDYNHDDPSDNGPLHDIPPPNVDRILNKDEVN